MKFALLAFYHLTNIENPFEEVQRWKQDLMTMQARGRIYISTEGINAQMSLAMDQLQEFETWLTSVPSYKEIPIKVHQWHQHGFEKLTVKVRKQLVAFDYPVNLSQRANHVSAKQWREMLEERDPSTAILDVRNQYEYDIGHFEGAIAPGCNTFRDYRAFADKFSEEHDPKKTRVLMYCTGGIRCEFFSAYLKEKGFENINQLEGGVIQYGLSEGSKHWKGKLFVFDDRMAVSIDNQDAQPISHCKHCQCSCDDLYNCANTDCNNLFVSCPDCVKTLLGCCCESCTNGPRLRPVEHQNPHKPFRKWHLYSGMTAKKH